MTWRCAVPIIAGTILAGCNLTPPYVRNPLPVPASWPIGDAYLRQSETDLPSLNYVQVFVDERLQAIIVEALRNNRNLRTAAANIVAQRAQYRIQRGAIFPQLDATARYSYADNGGSSLTNTGSTTGTGAGGTGVGGTSTGAGSLITTGRSNSFFSANLGVSAFELDVFGRLRSLTDAELNRYFATEAAARATRLTIVGDVANAWLTYASDQSLLRIAQETAKSAAQSVRLTRARLDGGIAPRTDLRQAEQILDRAQSDLAIQKTALAQDINALQLLVGAPVDPSLLPQSIEEVANNVATLPAGLSSAILLRRPDVVQSEYQLRAANAEIGAARAALFPRISLTGLVGFASNALRSLFTSDAFNYQVAPSVSYPIFRGGAGVANVEFTQAQRDSALSNYEFTIQTAFREVSDALARQGTVADQLRADGNLVAAARDNYQLTDARYKGGIDTFLNSLIAQRSYYDAQRTLVATQLTGAVNRVTLYRVLGGDSTLEAIANGPVLVTPVGRTPPSPNP